MCDLILGLNLLLRCCQMTNFIHFTPDNTKKSLDFTALVINFINCILHWQHFGDAVELQLKAIPFYAR
jgi:hypothetical protein